MKRSVWRANLVKKTVGRIKRKSLAGGLPAGIRQAYRDAQLHSKSRWPKSKVLRSFKNLPLLEIYSNPTEIGFYLKEVENGLSESEQRVAQLLKHNSLILDVGCAGGREAVGFAQRGHRVLGIDANKAIIPQAKRLAKSKGLNIEYRPGIFPAIRFPNRSFDTVLMTGIAIAHTPHRANRVEALREAARIVKPDGFVVVEMRDRDATPYERSLHNGYIAELTELLKTDPQAEFGDSLTGRSSKRVQGQTGLLRYHFHSRTESLSELSEAGLNVVHEISRMRVDPQDASKTTVYVQYVCKPRFPERHQ